MKWFVPLMVVVLLATIVWFVAAHRPNLSKTSDSLVKPGAARPSASSLENGRAPVDDPNSPAVDGQGPNQEGADSMDAELMEFLNGLVNRFKAAQSEAERLSLYSMLRSRILSAPDPLRAAKTISAFLRAGQDCPTGLDFIVGSHGFLDTAPTLRTALLDFVAELDADIALNLAREIMDRRTSSDEYAIALRNLAWSPKTGVDGQAEVTQRFSELLNQNDWLANPSIGYLEAFDAAVALSNEQAFLDLASVWGLQDAAGNQVHNGVTDAAALALDRLMVAHPEIVAAEFRKNPDLLNHGPVQRAALLSRLDIREPGNLDLFVDYVTKYTHGPGELEHFGALFPNMVFSYGPRLISSQESVPGIGAMQNTDQVFLEILRGAQSAGRLPNTPVVQSILNNLQRYVDETAAAAKTPIGAAPAIGESRNPPASTIPGNPSANTGAPGRVRQIH